LDGYRTQIRSGSPVITHSGGEFFDIFFLLFGTILRFFGFICLRNGFLLNIGLGSFDVGVFRSFTLRCGVGTCRRCFGLRVGRRLRNRNLWLLGLLCPRPVGFYVLDRVRVRRIKNAPSVSAVVLAETEEGAEAEFISSPHAGETVTPPTKRPSVIAELMPATSIRLKSGFL
jgi:hypothetical protein